VFRQCGSSGMTDRDAGMIFRVEEEDRGLRLDVFLANRFPDRSRSFMKKLILDGLVLVNGRTTVKPGYEVRADDEVSMTLPEADDTGELVPQSMPLDVLHEDEDIIVVNKAPGVVVHPGAGHSEGTLVHGLLAHCPRLAMQGAPKRPGIVHRLDQNTSGAMVVAKTEAAYLCLIRQFKEHQVFKEYRALVYGIPPQRRGEIRTYVDRHPVDRKKMAVAANRGREAVSIWEIERDWGEVSLLKVIIQTGRTHQIRVHFSYLQHPVVGDETYGGGRRRAKAVRSLPLRALLLSVHRQMLHASRLAFRHPATGAELTFVAPLPEDFKLLLASLSKVCTE